MDILVLCNFCAIFVQFFVLLFLLISRIKLHIVNKKILDNITLSALGFSFLVYLADYFTKTYIDIFEYRLLNFGNILLEFGLEINENNILFLVISSFLLFLTSIFIKHYFNSKKQFIFVKQRYITYYNLLVFNVFCFLTASNLFTSLIFWITEGIVFFLFCFTDIKKNFTKSNIVRFQKITLLGDFSLFVLLLMLLKYEILSQGYIITTSVNYNDFDLLVSYVYGIASGFEFKIMFLCLTIAIATKFVVFPFNCYYVFLSNSSNIVCYPVYLINSIFGAFLITKMMPFTSLYNTLQDNVSVYSAVSALILMVLILFEKNVKIIFGNMLTILNCVFIYVFVFFNYDKYAFLGYFSFVFLLLAIMGILLSKDKNNFQKRIINIQNGFLIERTYILIFEKMFDKLFLIADFIKNKLIDKIVYFPCRVFSFLCNFCAYAFVVMFNKNKQKSAQNTIKCILAIMVIFILMFLFVSLFEESRC